ncbi:MAG: nuclear transport factor 2 family protein [Steroidobacteraceae bacterium]
MAAYHQAVASHDGARLSSMFIDNGSTWFNVLSDTAYASARAKDPAASKVRHSSFQWFANIVSTSHSTLDPEHSNVRILTDGTIASVYFNFTFLIDGKPENRGSETWQLLKTSDGWKIASIVYSWDPPAPGQQK